MATKRGQKPGPAVSASNGKAPAPSPANAWARPLKTTGPPPGMGPADKSRAPPAGSKPSTPKNSSNEAALMAIHRERLLHLSLALIGQKVVANLTDGTILEGIFHTFTPFDGLDSDVKNKYVFKAVKTVKPGKETTIKTGSTVILGVDKVTQIYAKNINLDRPNKNGGTFSAKTGSTDLVTDTQISGARSAGNRDLVAAGSAWTSAPGVKPTRAEALAGALGSVTKTGDISGLKGSIGGWDQFKANQELFNVNASFDENLYTTELDKSQMDSHKIAEAERIAREIEGTTSTNIHIAEERGHALETDYDEEDRYSGVLTKDGKQRHDEQIEKPKTPSTTAPKKMNYAAAAAKADAAKKAGPPGVSGQNKASALETKPAQTAVKAETEKKEVQAPPPEDEKIDTNKEKIPEGPVDVTPASGSNITEEKEDEAKTVVESQPEKEAEEKKETKEASKTSKLNANAKEFTFNPAAKSFTPSFSGGAGASFVPQQQQPQHMVDPTMQNYGGHPMQQQHYMQTQMRQPGMMMMNPQYHGMAYLPQYPTMDQPGVPQMPHQPPQHMQPPNGGPRTGQLPPTGTTAPASLAAPAPNSDGETNGPSSPDGDASQTVAAPSQQGPQSHQQPLQQQLMTSPYNVPPQGGYYPGGAIAMHPRGPGGYQPPFVGAPQQMGVGPQGTPYQQMYHMQQGMPPNMHMRGPGGAPYYGGPVGPTPYAPVTVGYNHGMMEDPDAFRGRGRGPGRGRGRGGGRRGGGRGPGRGPYPHHQGHQYPGSGSTSPLQHGGSEQGGTPPGGELHEGDMSNVVETHEASS